MGRRDRSDEEDGKRSRKKSKKLKRCTSDDEDDRKRRKKESSKKSRRRRDRRAYDSSESDFSSDESDDDRRRQKKQKKKKHKKEKKKRKDRAEAKPDDPLQRNYDFAEALHDLLDDHPALSSDLPVMLIRMAGGSSFDLSQMSDASAAKGLENIFSVLQKFGVERTGRSWTWKAPPGGQGRKNQLLLVQIAKTLLDQIGITMEAVDNYGKEEPEPIDETQETKAAEFTPLQNQAFSLLDRFLQKDSTMANQLGDLCRMIIGGESVALEGLPDQSLREGLEQLFRGAGLNLSEMDEEDDDEEEETTMGYSLPEANDMFARTNMESILSACKHRVETQQEAPRRAVRGPLPQSMAAEYASRVEPEDSEDDEGPAPAGMAKTRDGPSKGMIREMAEYRQEQMEALVSDQAAVTKPGEREEWMINPGEHDLLQGIKKGGMKSRNFENKKVNARVSEMPAAPVDPSMQAEVDAIIQAHKDARGPSLMDKHRENKAAEKSAKAEESGNSFNWKRDTDLDSGRRVDKDALRLLMGGAGGELNDKFQGGFSKT